MSRLFNQNEILYNYNFTALQATAGIMGAASADSVPVRANLTTLRVMKIAVPSLFQL